MENKTIAHCIHHTHWDPFWYFTAQDSMVVFSYNVKEILRAFDQGLIEDFFLDGQTAAIDEYIETHPEDEERIRQLIKEDKLIIGPFVSQLDTFISSGESIINNLRLGIKHANQLGKTSMIAYLADPFGQSVELPKIYNQFGIHDFVFTRGVGDIYDLGNEFYFESSDGSQVLCHTLMAGYGYGTYAFINRTLFTDEAEDYNKINVDELIERLLKKSTLPNEFVFPLGFDQNPIMLHIPELISFYNQKNLGMEFRYTNWREYFARVREHGRNLKTFKSELISPQYHRLHLSGMNSARADIKTILDKAERSLTYETQPLMAMLDSLGIPYDQGIIDKACYTMVNCQCHTSATHGDVTNLWVKENGLAALNYSEAAKLYLMRLVAASLEKTPLDMIPVVVFNPIPWRRENVVRVTVLSRSPSFDFLDHGNPIPYSVMDQEKAYGGVIRKDEAMMNEDKWFYKTNIIANVGLFEGLSYKTLFIKENDRNEIKLSKLVKDKKSISNKRYFIEATPEGINITDKKLGYVYKRVIFLEDGGDEGDSYDYSYPDEEKELIITDDFSNIDVECVQTPDYASMVIKGTMLIPASLDSRTEHQRNTPLEYQIHLELTSVTPIIRIYGEILNQSKEHRTRLGIRTGMKNEYAFAGTQFGYIKRPCDPIEMRGWRKKGYFEEPCSTRPLLNHVSAVGESYTLTVFTRNLKEYDFTDDGYSNLQLTLFRSVGYVGLPDLNRRPGRSSGLANKIFEASEHQMLGQNTFDIGLSFYQHFDGNQIMRDYAEFAVDSMCYQNQNIDRTIYPIAYFPINPLESRLPLDYEFLTLKSFTGSYGTVKKAEKENGYILEIFNSEQKLIKGGDIKVGFNCKDISQIDLREESLTFTENNLLTLKNGELKNLLLKIDSEEA